MYSGFITYTELYNWIVQLGGCYMIVADPLINQQFTM